MRSIGKPQPSPPTKVEIRNRMVQMGRLIIRRGQAVQATKGGKLKAPIFNPPFTIPPNALNARRRHWLGSTAMDRISYSAVALGAAVLVVVWSFGVDMTFSQTFGFCRGLARAGRQAGDIQGKESCRAEVEIRLESRPRGFRENRST
jgi:hypothetical protein